MNRPTRSRTARRERRLGKSYSVPLVVLAGGSALAWNPFGLSGFHAVKVTIITVCCAIAARALVRSGRIPLPPYWQMWPAAGGLAVLSALAAGDARASLLGYADRHAGLVMWCCIAVAFVLGLGTEPAHRVALAWTVVAAGAVVALLGLAQLGGLDAYGTVDVSGGRPTSTFGSAAFSGAYCAVALPLAWGLWTDARDVWSRRLLTVAAGSTFAGVVASGSRAAWVGLAAAVLVVGVLRPSARRLIITCVIPASAAIGVAAITTISPLRDRVESLASPTSGTAGGRMALWSAVWPTVRRRPVLGWGPDHTRTGFPLHLPADFEARFGVATIPDRAHNVVADLAIWMGLPFVLIATTYVALTMRLGWTSARSSDSAMPTALVAALVAYIGHLMFNFTSFELDVTVALVAGCLLAASARSVVIPDGPRAALSVALVVAGLAAFVWGGRLVLADSFARQAVDAESAADVDEARQRWLDAVDASFDDPQMLEALSRFELRAGNIDAAVAAADRAARTHDDPFLAELAAFVRVSGVAQGSTPATPYLAEGAARYRDLVDTWPQRGPSRVGLGVALALMGDADAAIRELLVAAELGPASAEPWSNLAQIYLRRGDTEQAREAVREGLSRVPDDEPLLALNQQLEEA